MKNFEMMTGLRMLLLALTYCGTLEWVGEDRDFLATLTFSLFYIAFCCLVIREGYRNRLVKRRENYNRLVFENGIFTPNEVRERFKNG